MTCSRQTTDYGADTPLCDEHRKPMHKHDTHTLKNGTRRQRWRCANTTNEWRKKNPGYMKKWHKENPDYNKTYLSRRWAKAVEAGVCFACGKNAVGSGRKGYCLQHRIKENQRKREQYTETANARDTELMRQLADGREHGRIVAIIRKPKYRKVNMREKG